MKRLSILGQRSSGGAGTTGCFTWADRVQNGGEGGEGDEIVGMARGHERGTRAGVTTTELDIADSVHAHRPLRPTRKYAHRYARESP